MMKQNSLAVFCGSKSGNDPIFTKHAQALGLFMIEHNMSLVYGGGSKGLMGIMADTVMNEGGKVTGVIPKLLMDWEHHHQGITELIIVDDMHNRKKKMYELCDAAVILPGGFGTLDELFEMLTWNQLNIHNKKIFLLNSNGFYNSLILHVKKMEEENFLYERPEQRIVIINTPEELKKYVEGL